MISDETYGRWKSLVPFVYDWFAHTRTSWPSLCSRWGEVLDANPYRTKQRVYLTEQTEGTNAAGKPLANTILVCQAEVLRPRVAAAEHMIFDEHSKSPILKKEKALWHPGEVNRMRCVPGQENVLLTHTDAPEVFVFDANGPGGKNSALSRADGSGYTAPTCVLLGHTENAEYALAVSQRSKLVASGGKDGKVLTWSLDDASTAAATSKKRQTGAHEDVPMVGGGLSKAEMARHTCVAARSELTGHTDTIEDVCFNPSDENQLCSVGDDRNLFLWDTRAKKPAAAVKGAHEDDIHCVAWSSFDQHVIVTGSKDTTVKVWDRRKAQSDGAMHSFDSHVDSVLCIDMHPQAKGVFMTADEIGRINVFDYNKVGAEQSGDESRAGPSHLIFQHSGHRGTVWDIQWNPYDQWTACSTSVGEFQNTLQLWRVNDLIYRDIEQCIDELERHRDIICGKQVKRAAEVAAAKVGNKEKKTRNGVDGEGSRVIMADDPKEEEVK